MWRIWGALVLVACLRGGAAAGPDLRAQNAAADPKAAASESSHGGDLPPAKLIGKPPKRSSRFSERAAALTLAGIYVTFAAWTVVAWYDKPIHKFTFDADPQDGELFQWLGRNTYAGGADKLGHAWSTMGLARVGTELLHLGGMSKLKASIIGAVASESLFLAVEIVDGFHYSFSYGDLFFNTAGALLAVALSNSPRLDDLVDFRVEYLPSKPYRHRAAVDGDPNFAEDYSGQTYLLALHLGGIPALREGRYTGWSRFVDVAVGFKTRGYRPDPPWLITAEMPDYDMKQMAFLGVTLNAQGLFDYLLKDRAPRLRSVTHGAFELVSVPFTTLGVFEIARAPTAPIGM